MTQGQLLFSLDKLFGNKPFLERATLEKKHNVDIIKTSFTAVKRHFTDWYEICALTDHEIYYIKMELDL